MNKTIESLVEQVQTHDAPLYREHWGSARRFADLPPITSGAIAAAPLERRRYGRGDFAKVIAGAHPFLLERALGDIAGESFGLLGQRPAVLMHDAHDALEKALWCYELDRVPLVCERDPQLAAALIERYDADTLITDEASARALLPHCAGRIFEHLTILGSSFSADVSALAPLARTRVLVLALPETGAFAQAALASEPRFSAAPGWVLEHGNTLVVTSEAFLVTPVIRFDTGIATRPLGDGTFTLAR